MGLFLATLSGFALALLAPLVHRRAGRSTGWILSLLPAGLTAYFLALLPRIEGGGAVRTSLPWAATLDLELSLRLDGLSLLFALAVTAVGAVILVYSGAYFADEEERAGGFHALLLLFMASMLGLVLADNLLALFVFWELTALTSFLLIGFHHAEEAARKAAWKALMVTAFGGQALLAGFLLLGVAGGSLETSVLLDRAELVRGHSLYAPAVLLVLLGAFTKSAQAPFHFWLPAAMEAPTPVSAYLHSAAMVKAGVYLIARLTPLLGGTLLWTGVTAAVGAATMAVGALWALEQVELKKILAYATVSVLGALVLLLGLGTEAAVGAALLYLVVHVLYKAGLFLVAGSLDHGAGAKTADDSRGLARAMPLTAGAAVLAALSMIGIPPFVGFAGKEELYHALREAAVAPAALVALAAVSLALLVAVAAVVGIRPFAGSPKAPVERPREAGAELWLAPLSLGILALVLGGAPQILRRILDPAAAAVGGSPGALEPAPWPEWSPELALSGVSVAGGIVVFALRRPVRRLLGGMQAGRWGPGRWYERGESALDRLARGQTAVLQHGYLRYYLLVTVLALLAGVGWVLVGRTDWPGWTAGPGLRQHDVIVAVLLVVAAGAAVRARSVIGMVVALGVIGLGEVLVYVLFGAPDLAMAQVLVQTFVVVMFVFLLSTVTEGVARPPPQGAVGRARDGAVALGAGALMAALVLLADATRLGPRAVSDAYLAHEPGGSLPWNVVNRILVDFRAMDTLGEVTVLATAGMGVALLLGWRRTGRRERIEPLILTTAVRLLSPVLLLFSVFLLLRGEHAPGGGFSGGLVAAAAFAFSAFAFGARFTRGLARVHPPRLMPAGLALMVASGLPALLRGEPFLSHWSAEVEARGRAVEVGTPLLFETGVYLTVVGGALTVILYLARERR